MPTRVFLKGLKKPQIILILILLIGFFLRILSLGSESIWLDEAISAHFSQMSVPEIMAVDDPTPPLYYLLLHFTAKLLGSGEFALRLPSVLFGILSIWLMYLIGKLLLDRNVGLIAAFLLALSPFHAYYSQEARVYSLFLFLALLSVYFFIKILKEQKGWMAYAISALLLLYTHPYAIFILLFQNMHYLIYRRKELKKWILIQSALFILYIPEIIKVMFFVSEEQSLWLAKPTIADLAGALYVLLSGYDFSLYGIILLSISLVLIALFLHKTQERALLCSWFLIPLALPFLYSVFFSSIFNVRYLIIALPPILLMMAKGISCLKKKNQIAVLIMLLMISLMCILLQARHINKDDWRAIASAIPQRSDPKVPILIINSYELAPFLYYYGPECMKEKDLYTCAGNLSIFAVGGIDGLKSHKEKEYWIILSRLGYNPEKEEILSYLDSGFTEVEKKAYVMVEKSPELKSLEEIQKKAPLTNWDFSSIINEIEVRHVIRKNPPR